MKMLRKLLYMIPLAGMILTSCVEVESEEFEHIGGYNTMDNAESEQYYAELRAWKETGHNYGRPVSFGWFSNWSPAGPIRKGYLASLPDSIDMVSMWSNPFDMDEAKIADKNIFQQKKGGKIFACFILHNIGKGITPSSVSEKVQAENPDASSDELNEMITKATEEYWGFTSGEHGTEDHIAAIRKYARAMADKIVSTGYDGLDIDWEPSGGGDHGVGSLIDPNPVYIPKLRDYDYGKYLHVFVEELGKYFGPLATERPDGKYYYLAIDGEIWHVTKESAPYFDYFISQAYYSFSGEFRINQVRDWCEEYYDTRKHILTEDFERNWNSGGVLLDWAGFNSVQGPKGGVGAYRLDNDYDNTPDYKYMRQAIQINQQVYREYIKEHSNNTEQQ